MLKRRGPLNFALIILPALMVLTSATSINYPHGKWVVHAAAPRAAAQSTPEIPRRQAILGLMHKVNSWQLAHPVMKPDDRNWERGTWYTGVMAAWKATKDRTFLDQALKWGRDTNGKSAPSPTGRIACSALRPGPNSILSSMTER